MGPEMPMAVDDKTADPGAAQQVDELEKQLAPPIADSYNNLGAIAGSKSDYRSALRYFEQAAEWNPTLPGLDRNWGRAAFAAGTFAQAVGPLDHYLQSNPKDEDMRAELGLSQFSVKDYAAARKTLEPLDGTNGEAPQLQYVYAESLIETGDTNSGVTRLLALEKANPEVADVHRALGEAYMKEKSAGAADEFETAIRLNPEDAEAHVALARLQLAQGNTTGAVAHLEAAVKLEPGNVALQKELADVSRAAAQH
jgi:tetratricopeptide (TPR) repeat protein